MPKLIFEETERFLDWMEGRTSSDKHTAYITEECVVLMPNVSTPPVEYAILFLEDEEAKEKLVKAFKNYDYAVYRMKKLRWKVNAQIKKSFL